MSRTGISSALTVAGVAALEAGLSASLAIFLHARVFSELCDDMVYRDQVVRGLGPAMGAVGLGVGILAGLWIVAKRCRGLEAVRVIVCSCSALCAGCCMFTICCVVASMVPISMVSLCFACRPWWRTSNWVFGLLSSLFVGGIAFLWTSSWARRPT